VAGLKTHQIKMDVIGNNIANVNTVGYKSQSINFAELMYQTSQSASGPNTTTGTAGVNAKQIGLGVKSAAITTAITQAGSSQTTGNPFDLQLKGDAFFVVSDGSNRYFTRDGSFNVDAIGNLAMSSNGYNVMGWQVDETTGKIKKDTVSPLKVLSPENMTYPPEATTRAYVSGIIDKNDPDVTSESGKIMNLGFFDNAGYAYTAKLSMKATGVNGEYSVEVADILDSNAQSVLSQFPDLKFGNAVNVPNPQTLNVAQGYTANATSITYEGVTYQYGELFTDDEQATAAQKQKILANAYGFSTYEEFSKLYGGADGKTLGDMLAEGTIAADVIGANGELSVNGKKIQGGIVKYNDSTKLIESVNGLTNNFTLDLDFGAGVSIPNGPFATINIDFSSSSNYDAKGSSTIGADPGDKNGAGAGRRVGKMSGVSIEGNGMIYAHYDNGQTKLLGQIAVAEFPNAAGLEKQGDNLYAATLNSGEFDGIGVDVTSSGGYISTGVLEMSNVDLSSEFTEMITTQRGFQANSRIITVSDTLLEELVNLKR
ncbi:MAG: flagellar hook-basal body complex protein, partial [Lachnospiraceae bacterium]|nr:flagellar hook-basal body complex protein [Lachnospiraceae bacterium]